MCMDVILYVCRRACVYACVYAYIRTPTYIHVLAFSCMSAIERRGKREGRIVMIHMRREHIDNIASLILFVFSMVISSMTSLIVLFAGISPLFSLICSLFSLFSRDRGLAFRRRHREFM